MIMEACWNGRTIARSDDTISLEGNHYFPADAVDQEVLSPSDHTTICPWKGTARYHSITVNGARNADAAWYYAQPLPAAAEIAGRIAFWRGVEVQEA